MPRVILTSVYDANSNRSSLAATVAGTADFKNDYTYDNLSRMTRVEQLGQSGGNTVAKKAANFVYNALGQFTSIERQVKPSTTWNEVATTAFTYDTLNRVTGIDHNRSGTSLFTPYSYTYDRMDRITGITSQDGTVAYTYDKTSQLSAADYSYQTDEAFTWDANGNRSDTGYTTGTNNRMTSDGTYNYTYDDEGNLTRRTKISDSSYTEYAWDHRNRLTNVTDKTSGGTSTMSADYAYNVYERRIKKVVGADGAGAGSSVTTRYVYEDEGITRVVLQYDGSNNLTHRYLHGPTIDQLLADEDSSNALLWSLTDHLGSVRDLVNNSGTNQNHIKYASFGSVTAESASSIDFLMGFAGMDRDEETGASYSWHRPTQNGRWLGEDPMGFLARDANLSRYSSNSPGMFSDPSGLEVPVHPMTYIDPSTGRPTPRSEDISRGAYDGLEGRARYYSPVYGIATEYSENGSQGIMRYYLNNFFGPVVVYNMASGYYDAWNSPDGVIYHHFSYYSILGPYLRGRDAYERGDGYGLGRIATETTVDVGVVVATGAVVRRSGRIQPNPTEAYLEWLRNNRRPVILYHQGDLSGGIQPGRPLSTSPVPELRHYRPNGQLYQFQIPADVYFRWLENGSIRPLTDLHAPTGIITPEIRVMPPATGQMDIFIVPPGQ